jgi:hypothetical protein
MAISRPFLLALLGVVLLGATVFAVQNARDKAADSPAPVAEQPADKATPAPSPAEPAQVKLSAQDALAAILEPGTPVDSGRFEFRFETQEAKGGREHDVLQLDGAFSDGGKGSLSNFDVNINVRDQLSAGKIDEAYERHIVATEGAGYIGTPEEMYQVPADDMKGLATLRSTLAGSALDQFPEFQLARWVTNPKVVGVENVDGVDATHVTGKVAAGSVARDVLRLLTAEASVAGERPDVPANTRRLAKESVKSARVDAWVGPDRIARRVSLAVTFDAPKQMREPGDTARWTANADFNLTEVNKVQEIQAPENVASGTAAKGLGAAEAKDAEGEFVMFAMGLDAPGGVAGTTFSVLVINRESASTEVAQKVLRAVENGRETVVFFRNPVALDDKATAESVKYLSGHAKKLTVFTDDVKNVRRYGKLVENLGVTQAPAIVFIDRRGTARVIEGYVDGPSLAQVVADAR